MSGDPATTPATGVAPNADGQPNAGADELELEVEDGEGDLNPEDDEPGEGEDEPAEGEGEEGEGEDEPEPEPKPETVEFEDDEGKKHNIPKALEKALLRNKDYTTKTQALAEDRKAFQANQASAIANIKDVARLYNIHDQIQAYEKVEWDTLQQQDPDAAASHWRKFTLLKDEAGQLAQTVRDNETKARDTAEREAATRLSNAVETCAKEIPGWSPTYAQQLADLAVSKLGFSKEETRGIDDPRVFKALHLLSEADKAAKTREKVQRHLKPQQTQPAPVAKTQGAKPTQKNPSNMNMAQYAKWRAEHPDG